MAFILCLFITALNFKVSKLTTVDTRISESLLTGVSQGDPNVWLKRNEECVHQEPAILNTKVPDFSLFDLRQIKTGNIEQLAWQIIVNS